MKEQILGKFKELFGSEGDSLVVCGCALRTAESPNLGKRPDSWIVDTAGQLPYFVADFKDVGKALSYAVGSAVVDRRYLRKRVE